MRGDECPNVLILSTLALLFMVPLQADDFVVDERLQSAVMTQLDLAVCADTALSFEGDNASAEYYSDLSMRMLDEADVAGWTSDDIATATFLVMENRTDIIVQEGDTLEDYRLRNYTGERCKQQAAVAQSYLSGHFPSPYKHNKDSHRLLNN